MPDVHFPIRYRLKRDPYRHLESLHPLERDADEVLWVPRTDLGEIETIEQEFKSAIEGKKTAFYLVQGESGCGTTTAANYLLYKFFSVRGIEKPRFVVGSSSMPDFDIGVTLRDCIANLKTQIRDYEIAVKEELLDELGTFSDTVLADPRVSKFNDLIWKLQGQLTSQKSAFGFFIANIRTPEAITKLIGAFKGISTAVIFTVDDYKEDRANISKTFVAAEVKNGTKRVIQLKPLGTAQAKEMLKLRWLNSRAENDELPFDDAALAQAFSSERPIKRVVYLMGQAVEVHSAGVKTTWPDDKALKLSPDRLEELVKIFDQNR